MKKINIVLLFSFILTYAPTCLFASDVDLKIKDPAPRFQLKTHQGLDFDLESRKGKWTVLYFFPKAETPGCTKQACSFRDNIKKIRNLGADVFGISTDNVKDQAAFHTHHNLNFILLADEKAEVTKRYGSKMPLINLSNRWTFIIDPELMIRNISKDVDPIADSARVSAEIEELQKKK